MRIAIVGSQEYKDLESVEAYVRSLPLDTVIVSGGAEGVDKIAEATADALGMQKKVFLPEWTKYGKPAGPIRNKKIVADAEKLVAFWDGKSRGTKNSIALARKKGIEVEVWQ